MVTLAFSLFPFFLFTQKRDIHISCIAWDFLLKQRFIANILYDRIYDQSISLELSERTWRFDSNVKIFTITITICNMTSKFSYIIWRHDASNASKYILYTGYLKKKDRIKFILRVNKFKRVKKVLTNSCLKMLRWKVIRFKDFRRLFWHNKCSEFLSSASIQASIRPTNHCEELFRIFLLL